MRARFYLCSFISVILVLCMALFVPGDLSAQTTKRVSVTSSGVQSDGESFITAVSGDGRYVAFSSFSTNLIPGGTNGWLQVLRYDSNDGSIIDTSLDYLGEQADIYSWFPTISADGNRVAFTSNSRALVPDAPDYVFQSYVRDVTANQTLIASSSAEGEAGDDESYFSAISGNGRYVAFSSFATNIVPEGSETEHVYVKDLQTGAIVRASVSTAGVPGNGRSSAPQISYDGRYAVFSSDATNLVDDDTNGVADVFVRDLQLNTTERVNVSSTGQQANGGSDWPTISGDGRYVAFECTASNLVIPNTAAGRSNVYVYDRLMRTIMIASVDSEGNYGNAGSSGGVISANGRYVVFNSEATNLVDAPHTAQTQVYSHNLVTGQTVIVSVSSDGVPGNASSDWQSVSSDGRVVAFASDASDLVPNDTNGERDIFVHELGPPFITVKQIDSGGPKSGSWSADTNYNGGRAQFISRTISNIGSVPMTVYQTQRSGKFEYSISNLVAGSYTIKLHFTEGTYNAAGRRLFNVVINGVTALRNFDVFAAAGGRYRAVTVTVPATIVAGGQLRIQFIPVKTDAIVSGIEVLKPFE